MFVAEGDKIVKDLLDSDYRVESIVVTKEWLDKNSERLYDFGVVYEAAPEVFSRISSASTPQGVLAVAFMKEQCLQKVDFQGNLVLVLEDIRDPGNLGTIIRSAGWFGISAVLCSKSTVDMYNPKVVQSSMGSIFFVNVLYEELKPFLERVFREGEIPVYGTALDGENIYTTHLTNHGIIVMGHESGGISPATQQYLTKTLRIPDFNHRPSEIDSLNVAVSTAITCSEFRRRSVVG